MNDEQKTWFKQPEISEILKAVPMLQWRKCWECQHVGLYSDNILPECKCRLCGSADTRNILEANKLLHRVKEPE